MARRSISEQIKELETQRDALETEISNHQGLVEIEGQGNQGARTKFVDPQRLYDRLDLINNKLETLYGYNDR